MPRVQGDVLLDHLETALSQNKTEMVHLLVETIKGAEGDLTRFIEYRRTRLYRNVSIYITHKRLPAAVNAYFSATCMSCCTYPASRESICNVGGLWSHWQLILVMADVIVCEVLCFVAKNYRRLDKSSLNDIIAKFYHEDELYAAKVVLNKYVTELSDGSPPVAVDGWSKVVNKQGQPVIRKSGDASTRRCADADDIMYMMATLDVSKVPLPRFVAEDLNRIPAVVGLQCRSLDCVAHTAVIQLSNTVEELTKRLENMETRVLHRISELEIISSSGFYLCCTGGNFCCTTDQCDTYSVRFVGGLGGFNPPIGWRWPPHWWLKICVWGGRFRPPPVQIQHHSLLVTCAWNWQSQKNRPDLLLTVLMFNMHEIWSFDWIDSLKNY